MSRYKKGMTWFELVREYFPDATDEEVDFMLWEKTAYPMASAQHVEKQLVALSEEG